MFFVGPTCPVTLLELHIDPLVCRLYKLLVTSEFIQYSGVVITTDIIGGITRPVSKLNWALNLWFCRKLEMRSF